MRSNESVLIVEKMSGSAAALSDADTLDGLDSTAFVKTDGSTNITSTQAISQTSGNDYLRLINSTDGDNWDFTVEADRSLDVDVNDTTVFSADASTQQVTFPSRVIGSSGFDAGSSSVDNVTEVNTTGSGSDSFNIYDSANVQNIATFSEGGNVTIPNGVLNFASSTEIQDAGITAIGFQGNGDVNLASGKTFLGGGNANIDSQADELYVNKTSSNYLKITDGSTASGIFTGSDDIILNTDSGPIIRLDESADEVNVDASLVDINATVSAGLYTDSSGNTMLDSVVDTGQVTLSSGTAVVDTAITAVDATFMLSVGVDDPNADTKVAGRLFWDDSAGTYKVEIVEQETSVGNPTVNYDIIRVR
jgi:hypothetical protein